jgi:hypothetical protein
LDYDPTISYYISQKRWPAFLTGIPRFSCIPGLFGRKHKVPKHEYRVRILMLAHVQILCESHFLRNEPATVLVFLPIMRPSKVDDGLGGGDRSSMRWASTDSTHKTERQPTPQHGWYKRANTGLPQSVHAQNETKDKWDIQYNPGSTQFRVMGKTVRTMNSILACLDTRIRSWNSSPIASLFLNVQPPPIQNALSMPVCGARSPSGRCKQTVLATRRSHHGCHRGECQ